MLPCYEKIYVRYTTLATLRFCRFCVEGHCISSHATGTMGSPVNGDFACTTPSSFSAVLR